MAKVIVTKGQIDSDGRILSEEQLAVHKTTDFRRVVRKYLSDYDCNEANHSRTTALLRPRNNGLWFIYIDHRSS